jgi:hypothetical protein
VKVLYGSACYQLHVDFTGPKENFCVNIYNKVRRGKKDQLLVFFIVNFVRTFAVYTRRLIQVLVNIWEVFI